MTIRNPTVPQGVAGWLVSRWRSRGRTRPQLALLQRITLAPRQTLCLVEADGRRFLIASSPEGTPVFHSLDRPGAGDAKPRGRVSW
jgi:hypothetical protein